MHTKEVIKSQYLAALAMLEQTIVVCPPTLWNDEQLSNRFWQVAYHTLFYTHLYLQPTMADFSRWDKHRHEYEMLGPPPWDPEHVPVIDEPYTPQEVLEYVAVCRQEVETVVDSLDLDGPSGFEWLPFNKLELQLYSMRHLQHHVGELSTQLMVHTGIEIDWVGIGSAEQ